MRMLGLAGFIVGMTSCVVGFVAPAPVCCVTFVVAVNPGLFAPAGVMSVQVWNASQLATLDQNARCSGTPGSAAMQCPPGVTYKGVAPEQMQFDLSSLGNTIEVSPKQVDAGEQFRLRLAGPGRDRCNANSAEITRTAQQGRMLLGDLTWQTIRSCS
jgi:hypothetical protein